MTKGGRGRGTTGTPKRAKSKKTRPRPSVISKQIVKASGKRVEYERVKRRSGGFARVYTVRGKSQKLTGRNIASALKGLSPLAKGEKGRRVQIVIQRDGRSIGTLKYTTASDLTSGKGWRTGFESWVENTRYQSFSAIQIRVLE